jgi:hypothetical protein
VQDSLSFRWPAGGYTANYQAPGVNRPFIRVDKKVDRDSIMLNDSGTLERPWLQANLDEVLRTSARLDCRTPNSTIRYNAIGRSYDARGLDGTATGITLPGTAADVTTVPNPQGANPTAQNIAIGWRNTEQAANDGTFFAAPEDPSGTATVYNSFLNTAPATHITIGETTAPTINNVHGFIWQVVFLKKLLSVLF